VKVSGRGRQKKRRQSGTLSERQREAKWRRIERLCRVTTPDRGWREEVLQVFARYADDAQRLDEQYVDPADEEPANDDKLRAALLRMATDLEHFLKVGVVFIRIGSRGRHTWLFRLLTNRILSGRRDWWKAKYVPNTDPAVRGLDEAQIERVVAGARWWAKQLRNPSGPKPDSALAKLVSHLIVLIERRGGPKGVKVYWREDRSGSRDAKRPGSYEGKVYHLVRLIRPLLSGVPDGIGACSDYTLGARLKNAQELDERRRTGSRRSQ
jgi:hypothetical protein